VQVQILLALLLNIGQLLDSMLQLAYASKTDSFVQGASGTLILPLRFCDASRSFDTEPHCESVSTAQSGQCFPAYVALFGPYVGSTPETTKMHA